MRICYLTREEIMKLFMLLLLFLTLSGDAALAQTCKSPNPQPSPHKDPINGVNKANRNFNIEVSYFLNEMVAGRHANFTITISAPRTGDRFLEVRGLPIVDASDASQKFTFKSDGMTPNPPEEVVQRREYKYIVTIDEKAEPLRHLVMINFAYEGEPEGIKEERHFYLNVGVNKGGRLIQVPPKDGSQPPSLETGLFKGNSHTYKLELRNSFRDYTVYVEKIKIDSEPPGWIIPSEDKPNVLMGPDGEESIDVNLQTAPLGFTKLLKTLSTTPQLKANIIYNDGNARCITDFKPLIPIAIPPTSKVLFGSVFLGLLIGAGFRAVLEFMLFKKRITRKGVIKVVSYSLMFGMLLVILAAAGQIEIKAKAFALSSSYDNPLTLLVIGMIGALAGLQMIIGWYKSLKVD